MSNPSRREEAARQACAVPYRWHEGRLEFCLITTGKKRLWAFPKGFVEPGETPREAALKEAWEEAGVLGRLEGNSLGRYNTRKFGRDLTVVAYLMRVLETANHWHEAAIRKRRWLPVDQAKAKIARKEHLVLLELATQRLMEGEPASSLHLTSPSEADCES
jgi:8-oxo-dGTP pyrophosphatase MutT (NUDIX family)